MNLLPPQPQAPGPHFSSCDPQVGVSLQAVGNWDTPGTPGALPSQGAGQPVSLGFSQFLSLGYL